MRFRKLRITWSAFCGISCVLLCALWVRSYWWTDLLNLGGRSVVASENGRIKTIIVNFAPSFDAQFIVTSDQKVGLTEPRYYFLGFGYTPALPVAPPPHWPEVVLPHWFLVLLSGVFGLAPWIHKPNWRFSLRTLLLATTLVAVVLGLIVWSTR